jgi:5'-nucleotidase
LGVPLILITNDDGIRSAGLRAAVDAVSQLGEVLIAAPNQQWSGSGRSMPPSVSGRIREIPLEVAGRTYRAYEIDATPALCVIYAMLELVDRRPNLLVSGINFGENVSIDITISGTIGAALEGAAFGIPALAVSMEMPVENHLTGDAGEDYAAAKVFTQLFSGALLEKRLPFDADVLSINLPRDATPSTPWQLTRLARHRYFVPVARSDDSGQEQAGYRVMDHPERAEIGSDIWCLHHARQVSVTPLSVDLTSRVDFGALDERLRGMGRQHSKPTIL